MVTTAQGTSDLNFPTDAEVGDVFTAFNRITYELMPNLRWRNTVELDNLGYPEGEWTEVTDGGSLLQVEVGGLSPAGGVVPLYPSESILIEDLVYELEPAWAPVPRFNEIVLYAQNGNVSYYVDDFEDANPIRGWDVWSKGVNVPSFNKPQNFKVAFDMSSYVGNMSRIGDVSVRLYWYNSKGPPTTPIGHSWRLEHYELEKDDKNYDYAAGTIVQVEDDVSIDWPNSNASGSERLVDTGWIRLSDLSNYLWLSVTQSAGQRFGGLNIEIDDPSHLGDLSSRSLSGVTVSVDGGKVYASRSGLNSAVLQYDLATAHDLSSAADAHVQTNFDDFTQYPSSVQVEPLAPFATENGREFVIVDSDGVLRQWKLREYQDIATIAQYLPYNSWDYQDFKRAFNPVGNPLDVMLNPNNDQMYVLTDDNIIRRYSFTDQNISTSVYEDQIDVTPATANAKCFFLTGSGRSIVVPYTGGFRQLILDPSSDLFSLSKWKYDRVQVDFNNPVGIHMSDRNEDIYVAQVPADISVPMGITHFRRI